LRKLAFICISRVFMSSPGCLTWTSMRIDSSGWIDSRIQFGAIVSSGVSRNSCCGGWRKRNAIIDDCRGMRLPVRR
jgi:hypothetical protein